MNNNTIEYVPAEAYAKLLRIHLENFEENACKYCKHHIPCQGESCPYYECGVTDGITLKMKWDCRDYEFGRCGAMENSPCGTCITWKGFDNFEWNGVLYGCK